MSIQRFLSAACVLLAAPAVLHAQDATAVVGEAAPGFSLQDESGATHTLAQYEGQVVVLEWTNPECPYVVRHYDVDTMENLATTYGGQDVVWLAVNSSHFNTADDVTAWKSAEGFEYSTLLDVDGSVGHAYGARTTPHMFVVAADGTLAYAGAIDDNPRGNNDDATNYVDGAVAALIAGDSPSPSSTDPYGCSVKYE